MQRVPPENIDELLYQQKITGILFCESEQNSWKQILQQMEGLKHLNIPFRFHALNSNSIVGSDSKETGGQAIGSQNQNRQ